MGLEPGTTKSDVRRCLENWNKGDNGILDLSRAYRLKPGTGWLIPPCILHAPGSLCTYEPQWGSDVFAMYQSLVEGREVPWSLLVKDVPKKHHKDLDYLVEQLDWKGNTDEHFKNNHYLEPRPVADAHNEGCTDRWIVYGKVDGEQLFTAKELTVEPRARCTIKDQGAYGLITVQGKGKMNGLNLDCPKLIRFHELTEDEVFCSESAAKAGVTFENTSDVEPLVVLRYFGPEANPDAPDLHGCQPFILASGGKANRAPRRVSRPSAAGRRCHFAQSGRAVPALFLLGLRCCQKETSCLVSAQEKFWRRRWWAVARPLL